VLLVGYAWPNRKGVFFLFNLLSKFLQCQGDVDKLEKFYFENAIILPELQINFPDWEGHVKRHLSAEVRGKLRERGVPL